MPSARVGAIKDAAVAITYGLLGWGLCGVTMSVAMKVASLEAALILHALAAPVIFTAVSLVYFQRLRP